MVNHLLIETLSAFSVSKVWQVLAVFLHFGMKILQLPLYSVNISVPTQVPLG